MTKRQGIQVTMPFDLAELVGLDDHEIPVYPDNQYWLVAMRDRESSHPEVKKPVEKIMGSLSPLKNEEQWGLVLPRKCCIYVGENQLIKKQASARDKAVARYFRLIQKIAKKLKLPQEKVQKMVARTFENVEKLDPWLEEITAATEELQATDISVATVTVLIQQRLCKTWSQFDTLALPDSLFQCFLDYANNESDGWKALAVDMEVEEDEEKDEVIDAEIDSAETEEVEIESDTENQTVEGNAERKRIAASQEKESKS